MKGYLCFPASGFGPVLRLQSSICFYIHVHHGQDYHQIDKKENNVNKQLTEIRQIKISQTRKSNKVCIKRKYSND